jgi:hypothetical protein
MSKVTYDRWVGIWIPEASVESANVAAAELSGNPADALTFMRQATDDQGSKYYIATVPMREFAFDALPSLQLKLGGGFVQLATRVEGQWFVHCDFENWLEKVGLTILEEETEDADDPHNIIGE